MAFAWPDGVQSKTKRLISQVLWTLHLDFDGAIRDSRDAPAELMKAMEGHGVEIKNPMTFRMILPHLDGGKYGKLITRVVTQRRTPEIRLAVKVLPDESHLPDGAGGVAVDDRLDMQLFGDVAWPARGTRDEESAPARGPRDIIESETEPAREDARDETEAVPAREDARDSDSSDPARGDTRDDMLLPLAEPARGDTRDFPSVQPDLAREDARDEELGSAPAPQPVAWDETEDRLDLTIRRLDDELEELLTPLPIDEGDLGPDEVLSIVVGLMANLEGLVQRGPVESAGRSEEEWAALLAEKYNLAEQLARLMRRVKDAEARLIDRGKEVEGARLQMAALNAKYDRLEANNRALLAGERPAGQHLRAAERFISERPSDRPDRGRSRPNRPNGRTTGSDSTLAYSVG
jgi:hypothetical protein